MTESSGRERWTSPLDAQSQGSQQPPQAGLGQEADPVIGTPETDTGTWDGEQSYPNTCAIRAQEFIIEQFTGQEVGEDTLIQQALEMGWYDPGDGTPENPGGTDPTQTGNLLELYGIPVNQYMNADARDLANELAQGHKVIIGVDSGELDDSESPILEEMAGYADTDGADHAVVVSGIDTTDPENPQVIISDPGTGEAEARYPLDQFLAAWQDSEFFMAATQEPAPPTLPEMENFDYEVGHIPEVMGVPYEEFLGSDDSIFVEMDSPAQQIREMQETMEPGVTPALDPALLDPSMPGPTIDPALLDPSMPGPTVAPSLLTPAAPGPTIDPALLDPSMPGVTIDPALLDPTAPGLTVDPALLDPTAPGATIDPGFFDPNMPGPTVDPSIVDPNVQPANVDPISSMPPELVNLFDTVNQVIRDPQNFDPQQIMNQLDTQVTTQTVPAVDPTTGYPATDPAATTSGIPPYVLQKQAEIEHDIEVQNQRMAEDFGDSFNTFNTEDTGE